MLLTVSRVNPNGVVTIGGAVGVLRAGVSRIVVDLTISELEAVKGKLAELQNAGLITFSTSPTTDQADNPAEGATIGFVESLSMPRITTGVTVYVAQAGSDTSGDGTLSKPYATISRALQNYPAAITTAVGGIFFRVAVVPPYTGAGFNIELIDPVISAASAFNFIGIDAYDDPATSVNNVNDPRFTVLQGPLTSSAAALFNAVYPTYDIPTGVVGLNRVGSIVRVFRAGVEVGRGMLADVVVGATDRLYLTQSVPAGVGWTPTAGDVLYLCNCAVVLNTGSRIASGHRALVSLGNLRLATNTQGLGVFTGRVHLGSVQNVSSAALSTLSVFGPAQVYTTYNATYYPWLSASERLLTQLGACYISATRNSIFTAAASANAGGYINLIGSVIDNALQASIGGVVAFNHWQRGSIYVNAGSSCFVPTSGTSRGVLGGFRDVPWNAPGIFVDGGSIGGVSVTFDYSSIFVVPAGYGAFPCMQVKRTLCANGFQFNVVSGSGTLTTPVVRAVSFSEVPVVAGTMVGPAGQDVQAGASFAAYGSIPLVDANSLTRIAPYNA